MTNYKKKITIMVVDDHSIIRDGLEALLNEIDEFSVIKKAKNGFEAIEFHKKLNPDITLMDIKMPCLDGISAMKKILENNPQAKVVILTTYMGEDDIYKAFESGAKAYILKDIPIEEFKEVIKRVYNNEKYITPDIASVLAKRISSKDLTEREMEVLKALSKGMSNKEISKFFNISLSTVKTHIKNIFEKLEAKNRTEAIAKAIEKGIIHP
jgi:two-component system NarL family response regulator